MIIFGLILMVLGFISGVAVLWSVGAFLLVIGLILWVLGALGHAIGGRRHYY